MDPADLELRNEIYRRFVELGRAPTRAELDDDEGLRRLHDEHALVLDADSGEIRMANPFSAVPTPYLIEADGRSWYGNCAWDAFGIPAALHVDGQVSTTCLDCGDPIQIELTGGRPSPDDYVFHVAVPAAHWWDDIVFT